MSIQFIKDLLLLFFKKFQPNLLDGWTIKLVLFSTEHHSQHHFRNVDVLKSKKDSEDKLSLPGHQLFHLEHF